ncbi:hypothetical protein HMN09_00983400 [Mycena chlorophos]|uniref:F-box domain-containing protein n=1 Tax=Mycena chlorophos TaxID=658473 RepID=A0A8H6SJ72_MYCCL|nr:hypothetical protein HMN09_00983400 [Mycena chlorophos]
MSLDASPFSEHLNTSYCPTEDEVGAINTLLVEPQARLAALEGTIQKLQEERDALARSIAAHEALVAPMRRLPLDMLREIFSACLPSERNCAMSASEAPLLLARVCSRWRTVALETPSLWTQLHIVQPTCPPWMYTRGPQTMLTTKLAQRMDVARWWLDRSGQCPLSISLLAGDIPVEGSETGATCRLIELIGEYLSRWQAIDFSFAITKDIFDVLKQLPRSSAPSLTKLVLNCSGSSQDDFIDWSVLTFLKGVELRACKFNNCGPQALSLPINWRKLTRLELSENSAPVLESDIVRVLNDCVCLQTLIVTLFEAWPSPGTGAEPAAASVQTSISSPLHTLHLSGTSSFMAHVACPELRSLHFQHLRRNMGDPNTNSLIHLLSTSPKLKSIHLSSQLDEEGLTRVLHALPLSVTRLSIMETSRPSAIDDAALGGMFGSEESLPNLEELILDTWENFSAEAISKALKNRVDTRFRTFKAVFREIPDTITSSESEVLLPFTQKGIEILLDYPVAPRFSAFRGLYDTEGQYIW